MPGAQWSNRLLAILFGIVILLPLATRIIPGIEPRSAVRENRKPVARPVLRKEAIKAFPAAYEAFFNDEFGYRDYLIHLNNLVRYELFNVSGVPRVLAGREGWLFYTGGTRAAGMPIENHRGDLAPFPVYPFRQIAQRIEETRDALAARGIDYLLVIAPDKWSIYPEYLPETYQTGGAETCVEQLVSYLKSCSTVQVLDLRHALLANKDQAWPVYLKGDTHWSDLGAFHAAATILDTLRHRFPAIQPLLAADYEFTTVEATGTGLAAMLGLQDHLRENTFRITPRRPTGVVLSADRPKKLLPLSARQDNPDLPRAIMLRDSFGTALAPFVATGFEHLEFIWTAKAKRTGLRKALHDVKPDLVIEMRVERFMMHTSKYYKMHTDDFVGYYAP